MYFFRQIQISLKKEFAYVFDAVSGVIGAFLMVIAINSLWSALYAHNQVVDGTTLKEMMKYATLSSIFTSSYYTQIVWEIQRHIKSGSVTTILQKPVEFPYYMFSDCTGIFISKLIKIGIPVLFISKIIFNIQLNLNIVDWLLFLLSFTLGFILIFLLDFFTGMMAFIFVESWGFEWIKFSLITFASGSIVPLWFMPEKLRAFLNVLPFKGIYDIPLRFALGKVNIVQDLSFQLIWIAVISTIVLLIYYRFQNKLIVNGG
ncbi:MAG: ABC-2 family transporter protein [Halanaerobiales bacterium]|nr:ABC-2 family transporter protein [Halanaerobiales bacterium]